MDLGAAVERGDVDELIGAINGLCLDRDWEGLEELARRSRAAIERGRQLWPVAAHADYRLALEADPRWAAGAVEQGRGRFSPGPLTEVVASTHTWDELRDHLPDPTLAAVVAHERAIRGDVVPPTEDAMARLVEVPLTLQPWEPDYPLATYQPDGAEFPAPVWPRASAGVTPGGGDVAVVEDDEGSRALLELVGGWTRDSSGRGHAVAVEGTAAEAAGYLSRPGAEGLLMPVSGGDALALMAWCGASGGAHGRRRGMAAGRFSAWWTVAALTGLLDEWPPDPDEMGDAIGELGFYCFEVAGTPTGWRLGLAVEDGTVGLAWAVSARDPA